MLKVLVVEARDLPPVQGIGTNPYIRGVLAQQVRRSRTAWSTLRPAWNYLMDFPVPSLNSTLELDVMSQTPFFGADGRLGHVSLPLQDIVGGASSTSDGSVLVYRCEPLLGARSGELVLILEYKPSAESRRSARSWCARARGVPRRWAAQFRAFFLYHYWPCDKSIFRQYLKEPVDIALLLVALSPFAAIRVIFYTVLLICLCSEWPPDEHQIVQFILAFKGTAIFTHGFGPLIQGLLSYYSCARLGTCGAGGGPGSGIGVTQVAVDLYQEVFGLFVCFSLLPRTFPFRGRGTSPSSSLRGIACSGSGPAAEADLDGAAKRGGRMKALLKYNLACFIFALTLFAILCARDVVALRVAGKDTWEVLRWRSAENFFWARVLFGLSMNPFLFLLHPQINKLLTHSTPTGYTRLGTLQRYNPRLKRSRPKIHTGNITAKSSSGIGSIQPADISSRRSGMSEDARSNASPDPVEDLRSAICRIPGGSFALRAGFFGARTVGSAASVAFSVISFELRVASAAVSLGMRVADNTSGVLGNVTCFAARYVPGVDFALQAVSASAAAARVRAFGAVEATANLARQLPGGEAALEVARSLAADTNSIDGAALLQAGHERAEALKFEAAAGLAELLARAERLAEREASEALELVRPELVKVSQALRIRSRGFHERFQRAYCACNTMSQSLLAWSQDVAAKLPVASGKLYGALLREFEDLQAHREHRAPGWFPAVEAYSRMLCSAFCEAMLELRPLRDGSFNVVASDSHHATSSTPSHVTAQKVTSVESDVGAANSTPASESEGGQHTKSPSTADASSQEATCDEGRRARSHSPFQGRLRLRRRMNSRESEGGNPTTPTQSAVNSSRS
eukprot:TRINITY_DN31919_c0_g1_i1.p1 TRINITY_DN31919_c0_g1~~TRINITY_DN31919_c0_g1_i1.p1  ORF type:complete len:957 (+),score=88.11 TRINITY_DN31919_c0_g1_i1:306-2873(+)